MSDSKKTHVLTTDYILTECGLCEAGTMFSESDLSPATWSWLQTAGVLKSVAEIEQEADAQDESETETPESTVTETDATGASKAPTGMPAGGKPRNRK